MTEPNRKPMKYYIDFENVHGAGLKGVDVLEPVDEVFVFYSQAAETFHIEHAIDILRSKARIEFVEVDGGTRNAADFQLIVALFGDMSDEFEYAIISGDGGFDAAIKMGERMGLPAVRRFANIQGDEATEVEKPKSRRTRRQRQQAQATDGQKGAEQKPDEAPAAPPTSEDAERASGNAESQDAHTSAPEAEQRQEGAGGDDMPASDQPASSEAEAKNGSSKRRPRRRRRSQTISGENSQEAPAVANADQEHLSEQEAEEPAAPEQPSEPATLAEQVAELLAKKDVQLSERQLSTIVGAIEVANNRQDFYRYIIQKEKQKPGLALYRLVRDSFDALMAL